jgi:adenylate cyclase
MSRAYLAAVLGILGNVEGARQVWSELMAINPDYSFAEGIGRMPFKDPGDLGRIKSGLLRAGLPIERSA